MQLSRVGFLVFVAACQSGSPESATSRGHGPRFLDDVPRWQTAGPLGTCFGNSVAVGDLDGDDRPELIVADPPCIGIPTMDPGRIAIYRGLDDYFADTPTVTTLDWQNPPRAGLQMTVATGDVDGDGRADVVVRAQAGVVVFAGITDVGAPLGAPRFRVPGTGTFGAVVVADVDGDGLSDLVSVKAGVATVWRATPGPQPFTATRAIAAATTAITARDSDGDGRGDVIITAAGMSQLFRGCAIGAPSCDGGLAIAPTWSTDHRAYGVVPDLNDDGQAEALLGGAQFEPPGRVALHLSAPGGLAPTPVWTTLTDPNYPVLGQNVAAPGDLDGDDRETEFIIGAAGRLYAFFPSHHLASLTPAFAWPRSNSVQAQVLDPGALFTFGTLSLAVPGDVDGDGYADLVVGNGPEFGSDQPGHVYVFRGGRLAHRRPGQTRPYLPGRHVCTDLGDGRPDLTVDGDALGRSLFVEHRAFTADSCEVLEGCVSGTGDRRLLRFTTSIVNRGTGPAIIPGPETAPYLYHYDACHDHDHLSDFATYELRRRDGASVAVGRKQGWFLVDVAGYCTNDHPSASYFPDQGISPGWADVYESGIPCQWLDVTGVPDGRYTLRVTADTLHIVDQDDRLSDTAEVRIELRDDRVRVLR